jgi:hypothetical protein
MARFEKLLAFVVAVLAWGEVASQARADLHFIPLDGSDGTVKPEEYGYQVDAYRSGRGNGCVTIRLILTEAAARSFRFGRLTLTKGEQTMMESTLGLEGIQRTSDNRRLLTVTFAAEVIDDGELLIWSDEIQGQPVRRTGWGGFGGFRLSIRTMLGQLKAAELEKAELEKLAPRAAGLAQVEVVDIKEIDGRPMGGPLSTDVFFRILRGTGVTHERIAIVRATIGGRPPPFKPYGPVKFDTFKKGERYWVAFSSPYDWERCPQGVVTFWPDKDAPRVLEEAVRADHYAHRPCHDPRTGLTPTYPPAKDRTSWRVRMERDGQRLWEVDLPGEKYQGPYKGPYDGFLSSANLPGDLGYDQENRTGVFLFAETAISLDEENPYRLPAGKYRLRHALNPDNGKTAALYVIRFDKSDPSVIRYFDARTGTIQREERYDYLDKGGLAAGGKQDAWLRKLVRNYDAGTGKPKAEEVFRCEGSTFVPVTKP